MSRRSRIATRHSLGSAQRGAGTQHLWCSKLTPWSTNQASKDAPALWSADEFHVLSNNPMLPKGLEPLSEDSDLNAARIPIPPQEPIVCFYNYPKFQFVDGNWDRPTLNFAFYYQFYFHFYGLSVMKEVFHSTSAVNHRLNIDIC